MRAESSARLQLTAVDSGCCTSQTSLSKELYVDIDELLSHFSSQASMYSSRQFCVRLPIQVLLVFVIFFYGKMIEICLPLSIVLTVFSFM